MKAAFAKVASASFAHLAGLGRGKAAKAEDEDDKKDRDHEDVNDGAKKGKAEDDEPEKKDDDKKDGPDARAEDDDPDAESDDPEKKDDEGDDKKSKKAKASDEDDKKDDEKMKAAKMQERARCAAIFAAPAAAKNVALAAELAFNTDLSSEQATAILAKTPAAVGNPNRASANPRIAGAAGPEITGKQAVDSSWDRAMSKVTPQKRR